MSAPIKAGIGGVGLAPTSTNGARLLYANRLIHSQNDVGMMLVWNIAAIGNTSQKTISSILEVGSEYYGTEILQINKKLTAGSRPGGFLFTLLDPLGGGSQFQTTDAILSTTTKKVYTLVIQYTSNTTFNMWCNGTQVDLTYDANSTVYNNTSTSLVPYAVGGYPDAINMISDSYYNGEIYLFAKIKNSRLDPRAISANPWQIFKPQKRISYFDAPRIIAERTPILTSTPTDYEINLTSNEAGLITNYSNLGIEFIST